MNGPSSIGSIRAQPSSSTTHSIPSGRRKRPDIRGREGVLGALGVYRAAFASIAQTEPLTKDKIRTPVVAIGGDRGLGAKVGEMVRRVAFEVEAQTIPDCGHFVPEESPDTVVRNVLAVAAKFQF